MVHDMQNLMIIENHLMHWIFKNLCSNLEHCAEDLLKFVLKFHTASALSPLTACNLYLCYLLQTVTIIFLHLYRLWLAS